MNDSADQSWTDIVALLECVYKIIDRVEWTQEDIAICNKYFNRLSIDELNNTMDKTINVKENMNKFLELMAKCRQS